MDSHAVRLFYLHFMLIRGILWLSTSVQKKEKDVFLMTLKRFTVKKERVSRIFCWILGLSLIPSILLSSYYTFFWAPSQTYSAAEQEIVDSIVEITQKYGDEVGKVSVDFCYFPKMVHIQNGTVWIEGQSIVAQVTDFLLISILFFMACALAICLLYGVSCIFIRYED